ncbi:N-acetylneuraminate synthase family protein [Ferrovibrio sp.]|uniref:N-acetylneuraminate synthase family protein n=1 Tax=Ferrovibrio sp. TaxID=1917215 RepID=UPI00311E67FE
MKMLGRDLAHEVAVIAEIGVNHEGDPEVASKLLAAAAEAGADAVKFQSYTTNRFISSADPERFARVTRFALDEAAHRRLAAEAQALGIVFMSSAITEDWVPLLAELSPVIKIASGDLTFEPVIRAAARTGKQVIISTGCGSLEEIEAAIGWVRDEIGAEALPERLALLHCVSAYPAPLEQCNLLSIPFLSEVTRLVVGWSNHVVGPDACHAAVALGAPLVEVHVTDRKTGRSFRDHELSFEPHELAALVRSLRGIRSALGSRGKAASEVERPVRDAIRKGIVAARELPAGSVLSESDLMFARPATEFPAHEFSQLIGARIVDAVPYGALLKRSNVVKKNV